MKVSQPGATQRRCGCAQHSTICHGAGVSKGVYRKKWTAGETAIANAASSDGVSLLAHAEACSPGCADPAIPCPCRLVTPWSLEALLNVPHVSGSRSSCGMACHGGQRAWVWRSSASRRPAAASHQKGMRTCPSRPCCRLRYSAVSSGRAAISIA